MSAVTIPVKFTDAAVTHIQHMLTQQPEMTAFRLSIKKTGCSGYAYVPDLVSTAKDTDAAFVVQQGLQIFIDAAALPLLQDVMVDYVVDTGQGLKQKRLVFINPNEKGRCGCGESFTIE